MGIVAFEASVVYQGIVASGMGRLGVEQATRSALARPVESSIWVSEVESLKEN
jgi:hypothetical protein